MQDGPRDAAAGLAASRVRSSLFGGEPARMIGRYKPLRVIGKGGQGVVYEAEDPALDRRIALKLVEAGDPTQVRRVLREARMLARLPHPNIATIYDVGAEAGEVYIAMELVDGGNLQAWLTKQSRSRSQILDVMVQVARALAFAHDAAVVHCDVKPHNVLVGNDGRVRVVDFGLARLQRTASALDVDITAQIPIGEPASSYDPDSDTGDLSLPTGGGTPAYAAPEVWRNEVAEAGADQFGFFVMLHEALLGRRPFGTTPGRRLALDPELELQFGHGEDISGRMRELLRRGLAAFPSARHPTMAVVQAALERPDHPRRRVATIVGAGVLGATLLAFGTAGGTDEAALAPCHGIAGPTLDDEAALRTEAAERMQIFGEPTAAHASVRMAEHADRLRDFRAAACSRDEAAAQAQLACLAGREREYHAALDLLAHGGAKTLTQLAGVLDGLLPPDDCLTHATDPEDPVVADLLAQTAVLLRAGRPQDAYATSVLACAKLDDHTGVQWARCRGEMGSALMLAGRTGEAQALLEEAFELAAGLGRDSLAVTLAERLATLTVERHSTAEAKRWIGYLRAAAARDDLPRVAFNATIVEAQLHALSDEYPAALVLLDGLANAPDASSYSPEQRASIEIRLGIVRGRLGDSAAAHRHYDNGLGLVEHLTPGDPMIFSLHSMRAQQLGIDGRYEDALAEYRVALALAEVDLGPDSITATRARDGIADALMRLDRLPEALAIADDNVRTARTRGDPLDLVSAMHTRANVYLNLGQYEDARREAIAALTLSETEVGSGAATHNARLTYANALESLGKLDEARAVAKVALDESAQLFGPDHPETLGVVLALGVIEAASGNYDESIVLHRRARAGFEAVFGADHPAVAIESYNIGDALLRLGDPKAAIPEIERALAFWSAAFGPEHTDTRDAQDLLARAREAARRAG